MARARLQRWKVFAMAFGVTGIVLAAGLFTGYPAYGDQAVTAVRPLRPGSAVETVIDRGPILELVVACRPGTAIISFSKVEKLFCGPKRTCQSSLDEAIASTCRH